MNVNGFLQTAQIETFTSSTLPSASNYISRAVYTSDTKQFLISNGTAWLPSSVTSGTSSAQPSASSSYLYQLYFQTDTGILQICKLVTSTPTWVSLNTTLKLPTVQSFTSSGTYTPTSAAILYIKITAIGAGGGGGGSGSSGSGNGTAGGSTVVGSIITCTGGGYGLGGSASGGGGGTPTVITSSTVIQLKAYSGGNGGVPANQNSSLTYNTGGIGGSSPFYSAGFFAAGVANSGAGGAGGSAYASPVTLGSGGGAGGWCEVLCTNPSSLSGATITIGAGGSAGTAGTSGHAGYGGASGFVLIEEFYQ